MVAEAGMEWDDFINEVLPTDTLETFIDIGGTLDIARKRISKMTGAFRNKG